MLWDFILRLFIAGILGAVIGLDREYRAKEAGYRTHFLVSLGSALIMIVSQYGFQQIIQESSVSLDPSRVAAQVVSGIGFIGVGTIIIQKQFVRRTGRLPQEYGQQPESAWQSVPECTASVLRQPY